MFLLVYMLGALGLPIRLKNVVVDNFVDATVYQSADGMVDGEDADKA